MTAVLGAALRLHELQLVKTLETWYAAHGWADGVRPLSIPDGFRACLTPTTDTSGRFVTTQSAISSPRQPSVVDVIRHLGQQEIPGVAANEAISADVYERAVQLKRMYSAVLTFLR